jgi:hypothetical protein
METQEKAERVALTRGKEGEPKARRGGRSAINKERREEGARERSGRSGGDEPGIRIIPRAKGRKGAAEGKQQRRM